jgi:hypothetical protein
MKKFLAVYLGTDAGNMERPDEATIAKGMTAWHKWMSDHAASIVESGGPLGKTKRVGPDGVGDIRNRMSGYVIVQAESHDDAAKMFENHPHFSIFPGDSVEVMPCLPVPGQG